MIQLVNHLDQFSRFLDSRKIVNTFACAFKCLHCKSQVNVLVTREIYLMLSKICEWYKEYQILDLN